MSLRNNFSSKGEFFNAQDASRFIKLGIPQYLANRDFLWYKKMVDSKQIPEPNFFPSIKTNFYTVFYRFYAENREPEIQDILDIQINCIAPYLDAVFVENFQAEIFKKVKNRDNYLKHLEIYTLKDLRHK